MTEFTPWASLFGGALIGLSAVLLMATHGRIAGISGIAVRMFPTYLDKEVLGRVLFILGVVLAPLLYTTINGSWPELTISSSTTTLVIGGLLVGFGSVWGGGCTSGHGVCGLSRLSKRSIVAVGVFMTTAAITVYFVRHVLGGN